MLNFLKDTPKMKNLLGVSQKTIIFNFMYVIKTLDLPAIAMMLARTYMFSKYDNLKTSQLLNDRKRKSKSLEIFLVVSSIMQ